LFSHTKIGKEVFQSLTTPRQHKRDQQRAMTHQLMAAVVHSVLGFLVLVSNHNEVAMLHRHERRQSVCLEKDFQNIFYFLL
jgi:hypothetical protein